MATTTDKPTFPLVSSFADIPIIAEDGVDTTKFLEAVEALLAMFATFKFKAFDKVNDDMKGNVDKIRNRQLAAPSESETLQALVLNELKTKKHVATEGLVWLVRSLDFILNALGHTNKNPDQELADSFRDAYGKTLSKHHSWVVKPVFSAAMTFTPYRKDFYSKLGSDEVEVSAELEKELAALERVVNILKTFQDTKEAKW
ncbi:hypothetical protein N7452_008515 [Penicillium brevicompactum]|uniref:Glycolipid transfer protein domain-containing protein n=1 Tax=Penicillium brevicompactum TaxID=5074 RepID=A0A9W9Q6Y9_PENBR|nr:hypothetical protein N7452_008515 [Penicillium brevicompactum]